MKYFEKGFGLIIEPPKPEDARYGAIFRGTAKPFNWIPFLPIGEAQLNSQFCTNFSYTNCLETLANYEQFKHGTIQFNLSDRWSVVKSGTTKQGNSPQKVANAGNNHGNVLENDCPFKEEWLKDQDSYWNQIQDLSQVNPMQIYPGPNWSLVNTNIESLKSALAQSPLNIGVMVGETWFNDVVERPAQQYGGHAVELAWIDDKYMYIFDSAPPFIKKLSLDYSVLVAVSFAKLPPNWRELNLKTEKLSLMAKLLNFLKQLLLLDREYIKTINEKSMPESTQKPTQSTQITEKTKAFASAIEKQEGFFLNSHSFRNNNSGNLKYSAYIQSLGAKGKDEQGFAQFETYEKGFDALCQFLIDAAAGLLIPYRRGKEKPSSFTLYDFFKIYAPAEDSNHPKQYAEAVAKRLGVIPTTFIKDVV